MTVLSLFDNMIEFASPSRSKFEFTVAEFTKIIRQFVGTEELSVKTNRDSAVDINQVIISGIYDPSDDEANESCITIFVNYNPAQTHIRMADLDWCQLCIDIIEGVGHEIVHQQQFRSRNYDIGPKMFASKTPDPDKCAEQEYLGNPDEVEAYGYSIAAEVFLKYNPKTIGSKYVTKSPIFKAYCAAFGMQHIIVAQLLAFSIKYYKQLTGDLYVQKT